MKMGGLKFLSPILITAILFSLGCETINPLCTDNYCVEGEIYPKSELRPGTKYGELPIDDASIFAALAGTQNVKSEPKTPAWFVSATPPGGQIAANGTITVTFANAPENVKVSAGRVIVGGRTATILGPFTPGPLTLTITWVDGSQTLTYTVIAPETIAPTITGGTIKNGDRDVDPAVINSAAKIEVTFSEMVRGHIALQTFGGDDVGWLGRVEGNKGVLELARGKEIDNGTLYVIICVVTDALGNRATIKTVFHTKGVKRSVVEEPIVPEEPKVSFKDDILPIFKAHCQTCHRQRARRDPEAGLDLSSYKGTMKGSRNGKVIDPGWSKQSTIYWRIRSDQVIGTRMPPFKPPLSAEQIQLILDWIDAGAEDN